MKTSSPTYRITSQNGIVVANDLPRSAPSIQLHEGVISKTSRHPKEMIPGESSAVAYPLVEGRLICRVVRTDGIDVKNLSTMPMEFIEPDPVPKKSKPEKTETKPSDEPVKVRRGRGKKS